MTWLLSRALRPTLGVAMLASLLLNLALLVPALYMLEVFERVFASRSLETLAMLSALALLALALAFAMDRVRALALQRAGRVVDRTLSPPALGTALHHHATAGVHGNPQALQDVARLRQFLASSAVQALFDAPWVPLYLGVMFLLHPALGLLGSGAALALLALGVLSERLLRPGSEAAHRAGLVAGRHAEALARHAEVLVGMGMLDAALARWTQVQEQLLQSQAASGRTQAVLAALGRVLRQGVQVAMLGLGAWLVVDTHASPGIMVAATVLVARALQPVDQLISAWRSLLEVRAAWHRLQAVPARAEQSGLTALPAVQGNLQLERVQLHSQSGDRPILQTLNLRVKAGECLGLIGHSGSGKTSLVRVMLGLRRPDAGEVQLDGVPLSAWPEAQRAQAVGYLPQDVQLLPGSVAQNIARLGPVDAQQVQAAARLAGVDELIRRLPQAYDTDMGEASSWLSGGQRQRIALARAVYGLPRLVVLDEPNASLDHDGEQALAAAVQALKQAGCTVVLVSHRPWLMRQADRLAVLRDGALVALGPREEVLARLNRPAVAARQSPAATSASLQGAQA